MDNIKYNIEINSTASKYGTYQPEPKEFVELVVKVIEEKGIKDRANVRSFDVNILNVLNVSYPDIEVAYLISKEGIEENLVQLKFIPEIYSSNFKLLKNKAVVDSIKALGMRLIPWTVNKEEDIERKDA